MDVRLQVPLSNIMLSLPRFLFNAPFGPVSPSPQTCSSSGFTDLSIHPSHLYSRESPAPTPFVNSFLKYPCHSCQNGYHGHGNASCNFELSRRWSELGWPGVCVGFADDHWYVLCCRSFVLCFHSRGELCETSGGTNESIRGVAMAECAHHHWYIHISSQPGPSLRN